NFTTNLISVSAAEDRGVDVSYQNRVWTFKRDNLILFTGVRKNGIFQCCLAKSVFINWHERLGHLSDSKLSGLVKSYDFIKLNGDCSSSTKCEDCAANKLTKPSF